MKGVGSMAVAEWDDLRLTERINVYVQEINEASPGRKESNLRFGQNVVSALLSAFAQNAPLWEDFQECVSFDRQLPDPEFAEKQRRLLHRIALEHEDVEDLGQALKDAGLQEGLSEEESREFSAEANEAFSIASQGGRSIDFFHYAKQINESLPFALVNGIHIHALRYAFSQDRELWTAFHEAVGRRQRKV
jgi:hypothetical protein